MNGVPQLLNDVSLYGPEYFIEHYAHDPKREEMYAQEYERIQKRCAGGSVMDIGCGTGAFLSLFEGWTKFGYEPSGFASEQSRRNGVQIVNGFGDIQSQTMDLVIFRGTLQHINTPLAELAEATRILRRGGMLAILATPDTDSLVYWLWKDLPALEASRNWILFGSHYLRNILARLDYEQIEVVHPYWGTPYARPAHDLSKFVASLFAGYRKFAFPGNMMEIYAVRK